MSAGLIQGSASPGRLNTGTFVLPINSIVFPTNMAQVVNRFTISDLGDYFVSVSIRPSANTANARFTFQLFNATTSVVEASEQGEAPTFSSGEDYSFILPLTVANAAHEFEFRLVIENCDTPKAFFLIAPQFTALVQSVAGATGGGGGAGNQGNFFGNRITGQGLGVTPYFSHPQLNTAFSTFAWVADILDVSPFLCPKNLTLDEIGIRVTTTGTATLSRLGIYEDGGNIYPGDLVLDAGTVAVGTTGFKTITGLATALTAGKLYWLATLHNGGLTLNVTIPSGILNVLGVDPTSALQGASGMSVAQAFGALPDPFPVGATFGFGGRRLVFTHFSA